MTRSRVRWGAVFAVLLDLALPHAAAQPPAQNPRPAPQPPQPGDRATPSLFTRPGQISSAIQCCPAGSTERSRCLEMLTRLGSERTGDAAATRAELERTACAASLIEGAFASLSPAAATGESGCPPQGRAERRTFDPTLMATYSDELERKGWYGRDTTMPRGLDIQPAAPIPKNHLAISSPGCAAHPWPPAPGWEAARARCTSYTEVDVFVAMDEDAESFIDPLAGTHPWSHRAATLDRVRTLHAHSPRELQRQLVALVNECKIIRNLTVSGHGTPGAVHFGNGRIISTTQFLLNAISPCALSPHSKIQFTNCLQACGDAAPSLLAGINTIVSNDRYRPSGGGEAFAGVKLLFNTDVGFERRNSLAYWALGTRSSTWSRNNISWEVSVGADGAAHGDIPPERLPACRSPREVRGLPGVAASSARDGRWPTATSPFLSDPYR